MKKTLKICCIIVVLVLAIGFVDTTAAQAKVTYKLNKGTLTVKGKGKMPKKMTFKNNKKIKKIVIKNGVTSVSKNAFYGCKNVKSIKIAKSVKTLGRDCFRKTGIKSVIIPSKVKTIYNGAFFECKKLKTVTMPGKFKLAGKPGEDENPGIFTSYIADNRLNTVKFNSDIALDSLQYLNTNNFVAYKKDRKYKSIDGVLYSRDGKEIVRVPCKRKKLVIANGCETFCLSSIFYGRYDMEEGPTSKCSYLYSITIPASVKKIEDKKYVSKYFCNDYVPIEGLHVQSKSLDIESVYTLIENLKRDYYAKISAERWMEIFPQYIRKENDCYIIGNRLFAADANKEIITVPDNVQVITHKIFYEKDNEVDEDDTGVFKTKKVILPEGVKVIEDNAFIADSYSKGVEEINLPSTLERLEDYALAYTKIKKITVPDNIKYIGKYAFRDSELTEIILPKNTTKIAKGMFYYCTKLEKVHNIEQLQRIEGLAFYQTNVNVQNILNISTLRYIGDMAFSFCKTNKSITIPAYIQEIGKDILGWSDVEKITIKGSSKLFANNCFTEYGSHMEIKLNFERGIKESKADAYSDAIWYGRKAVNVAVSWTEIENVSGYKIQIASDKKFKKIVKKITASKKETDKYIEIKKKYKKVYIRIRPYKVVNGKKVYGRWAIAEG